MKISTYSSISFLVFIAMVWISPFTVSASTCVQLNSNLFYGQTDLSSGGPITILQTYLQLNGFLSSNPNGHFGPATRLAVQTFQKSNSISSTGYVGPLTRTAINQKTCNTNITSTVPINNISVISQQTQTVTPVSKYPSTIFFDTINA